MGKKQRLDIERLAGDGRGIAFFEGRTWFVSGALAGETVEARVLNARGKVVEARLERLLQASPERREAPCRHYDRCGGCNLQHLPHEAQLALKQRTLAEQLQRVAGVQPEEWAAPLSGPEFGYRRRARVAVRWDAKARQLQVGFRAEASQDIIAIDDCVVLVQPLQSILRHLPTVLHSLSKPQALGHVELFSGTAEALLVRHVAPLPAEDLARLQAFCEQAKAQLWLQGEGEPAPVQATAQLGFALAPWQLELAWRPGDFCAGECPGQHGDDRAGLGLACTAGRRACAGPVLRPGQLRLAAGAPGARGGGSGRRAGHGRSGRSQCPKQQCA